jgi:tripartite-type tricarboxylate transporter receptor subunit TctC
MNVNRRMSIAALGALVSMASFGQDYPSRPVRLIVPLSPGSGSDVVGRLLAQKLSELWNQSVVVENRVGAGGAVGTASVAKAAPDGYTLLVHGSGALAAGAALNRKLPYDALVDLVAVAPLASLPQVVVVSPSSGFKTLGDLIAAAKARPGQLAYASPGVGTSVHFTSEKFQRAVGVELLHVPYKGGPEAMNDVVAGRATLLIPSIGTALPLIQSGKLVPLAVTSSTRFAGLPSVPTVAESGYGEFSDAILFGVWAPAGVGTDVLAKIGADVAKACAAADVIEQLGKLAAMPVTWGQADFARAVRAEIEAAARVAKAAGMAIE